MPKILQTDNGLEYKNSLIKKILFNKLISIKTKYKSMDLLYNNDENIYNIAMGNIKKNSKKNTYEDENHVGENIKIKKGLTKLVKIKKLERIKISIFVYRQL